MPTVFVTPRSPEELDLYFAFTTIGYVPWKIMEPIEDITPAQVAAKLDQPERLKWLNEWKEQYEKSDQSKNEIAYGNIERSVAEEFNVRFQLGEWNGIDIAQAIARMKTSTVH